MTNGFVPSYTCIGTMVESMKNSSEGYWTKTVEAVEISPEEYERLNEVVFEEEEKVVEKKTKKTRTPKFSSLENFFEEEKPKKKK